MSIDTLPFKAFQRLRKQFPVVTVRVTERDLTLMSNQLIFPTHRHFVEHLFKKEGLKITRFSHNYKSLDTARPQLGLVFLAGDSIVQQTLEIHGLVGHNIESIDNGEATRDKV